MRAVGLAVVAGLFFSGSAPALGQGLLGNSFLNWNFLGGGARARGMGGAYMALSDDAHAGSWNPAGLVYNEGVLTSLTYSYSHTGLSLDHGPAGGSVSNASGKLDLSNLTAASFISPLQVMGEEFIVSLFYNRIQDVYSEGRLAADVDPQKVPPLSSHYLLNGNVAVAGASFGTVIRRRLTLGATLGIVTGDGTETQIIDLDSTRDATSWYQTIQWVNKSDLDYSGLNTTFGAMYKADRWSAGLVFTPGYTLTQSVNYRAQRIGTHNNILEYSREMLAPAGGTDREIAVGNSLALGGAYHAGDNLLFALDYQFRKFNSDDALATGGKSSYRFQNEPRDPNSSLVEFPVSWYNLHQIRVGMEYRRETSWGVIPIRLGVRNEPMLIGDRAVVESVYDQRLDKDRGDLDFHPYFVPLSTALGSGDQINGLTLSFGSGVHWSQVRLDAAFEFTGYSFEEHGSLWMIERCPDCLPTDPNLTDPKDGFGIRKRFYWGDYSRSSDFNRVRFQLNFTGYF
jgi:hypothetical protein